MQSADMSPFSEFVSWLFSKAMDLSESTVSEINTISEQYIFSNLEGIHLSVSQVRSWGLPGRTAVNHEEFQLV